MTQNEILAAMTEIFHDLFADDDLVLTRATTADDIYGWDSIKHISLIVAIEDRFGIKMKTSEIEGLADVGALVDVVQAKQGG